MSRQCSWTRGVLWGIWGSILANIFFAICVFIISVSSEAIVIPLFTYMLPAAALLGIHAGVLHKLISAHCRLAFMLAFFGYLLGVIGTFFYYILVLSYPSYVHQPGERFMINGMVIMIGILFHWIVSGWVLLAHRITKQ